MPDIWRAKYLDLPVTSLRHESHEGTRHDRREHGRAVGEKIHCSFIFYYFCLAGNKTVHKPLGDVCFCKKISSLKLHIASMTASLLVHVFVGACLGFLLVNDVIRDPNLT